MNCPQCSNEMIKAKATSFGAEYDYCRTCKKELGEMKKDERPAGIEAFTEGYFAFYDTPVSSPSAGILYVYGSTDSCTLDRHYWKWAHDQLRSLCNCGLRS